MPKDLKTTRLQQLAELNIEPNMLENKVNEATNALTTRERGILAQYYGLQGEPPRTFEEIAAAQNVSRERIKQIRDRALARLGYPPPSFKPAAAKGR
jgi:RNA polymerase primary sigma factor